MSLLNCIVYVVSFMRIFIQKIEILFLIFKDYFTELYS